METKYFEKLEFNKIREILENFAITFIGKKQALELAPLHNRKDIEKAGNQTTEASILIYRKGNLPIDEIQNITAHLKMLKSSSTLSAKYLLDLAKILKISRNLKDYFFEATIDMSNFQDLTPLFNNLYTNPGIEDKIFKSILDENTILDDASSTLLGIRRNIKNKEQEIRNKLNSMLHQKYIQEPIITVRNDRFVLPIKNEYRGSVKGFIHDVSSSGSTLFIEPLSIFELNNDINNLKIDESLEIQKILQKLSSLFFEVTYELENDVNLIGIIDFIFAKAKYSNSINASQAIISGSKQLKLLNAWHPLLDMNKAVKNDIYLGEDFNSLIITGPNTGGKTVTLKTVGLITLMAMSGLHIPTKEGSLIYAFDNIFADIGDEQSIQESLSTFSSHMSNISSILENVTSNSLVLLDELGSGTDPLEGANLAISILEELDEKKCLTISTTHYPELKHFAITTPKFENACVEFDLGSLSPTYKLLIGIPGTSNAFAISKKLGISDKIINRAKEKLNDNSVHIEDLLKEIYENKRIIEKEKQEIIENSKKAETLKLEYQEKFENLVKKENTIIENAKEKATSILLEAKEDANEIIRDIEKSTSSKEANIHRNNLNKKINEFSNLSSSNNSKNDNLSKLSKEDLKVNMEVFVPKLNQNGTILSINKDQVMLQVGIIKTTFKISDLAVAKSSNKNQENLKSIKREFKVVSVSPEINVLGQNVDEACFVIDKYLDTCSLNGLSQVRIVHGKGTGALRKGIHAFLKTNPHVKSFRLGTFGEGEMGVTVVELK
jgi:DNA mismatch repair protein MutS2